MSPDHQQQQCYHSDYPNESTWTTTLTFNLILGLGFSLSCLIEEPWIWARLLLMVGYAIATHVAIINCQVETFLWTLLFILANLYKLLKLAYDHRPSKVPRLLQVSSAISHNSSNIARYFQIVFFQELHQNVFRAHNFDKPTFAQLVGPSRLHGIGQDDPLFEEGVLRHDHGDLCILISGGLTVYYQDVLLHHIKPGQCINSVEWISMLKAPQETEDFGWEQQVCIRPNQDSMYLRLEKDHLEYLKIHHSRIWRTLEAMASADVAKKLYQMNDTFEGVLQEKEQVKQKALIKLVVRSISLECIHTTSTGKIVSDNWLIDERAQSMRCPHSSDGMPAFKNRTDMKRGKSYSNVSEIHRRMVNSSVSYLLHHSHAELLREAESNGTVIPSLRMQALRINPLSCRFRNEEIIREFEWDKSWGHCGNCRVCKPLEEGETEGAHPTVKA